MSAFSVCVVLGGTIAGIFGHPILRIKWVETTGLEYIDKVAFERTISSYLQNGAWVLFKHSNRFLFSSEELSQMLKEQFALASIRIGLQEGTLFIQLEERTSNLFWKTQERLYVVDLEGIVVREVTSDEDEILKQPNLKELPVFIDGNDVSIEIGSSVLTPREIENAFLFFDRLTEAGIGYAYIEVDRLAGKWVRLVTEPGYSILFDLTGDIEEQYRHLTIVLQEQVSDPTSLEYIDLRFGDKVYFK